MVEEKSKVVGSLPVPSVQALAESSGSSNGGSAPTAHVPERYVRPDAQSDPVATASSGDDGDLEIPIIDMSRLLDPKSSVRESVKLHLACQDWGFFQLINHSIPSEVIERMKVNIKDFFKLPLEKKEEFRQQPGNLEGYGQLFVVSEDQKLDWADILYLNTQPLMQRKVNLWPTQPVTLRDTIDRYTSELYLLAHVLMGFMFKNLGVNLEIITDMLKDGIQSVRMNYYPPCPQAGKVLGFSPHSDASVLTLVLQVNQVQGLQIKKNGGWIPVKPLPGAFIVNLGDIFEIMSNGTYRSIEHRATANKENERISIAAFHGVSPSSVIGPLPEIGGDDEQKYKTVSHEDYMRLFFSSKLDGKSFIDRMKLNG